MQSSQSPTPLADVARFFLRLGFTAFGGPAAHLAIMRDEVVTKRGWLTETEFLDLVGASNLIPGPSSTEVAMHVGYRRGGPIGLMLAGVCFILPAALMVTWLAWAYVRYGQVVAVAGVLRAVKPAVTAVVVQAIVGLARSSCKTWQLLLLGIAVGAAAVLGADPLPLLLGAGCVTVLNAWYWARREADTLAPPRILVGLLLLVAVLSFAPALLNLAIPSPSGHIPFEFRQLFLYFLKVGSIVYGSGYVLFAFLRQGLVSSWHWLTDAQLIDAIAVGQITPGPVFTTATFIGYLVGGWMGAFLATVGIFLPSFVFVRLTGPIASTLRSQPFAGSFLDGVNVAAVALMCVVCMQLARSAFVNWVSVAIAIVSLTLLVRFRVSSMVVIFAASLAGLILYQ